MKLVVRRTRSDLTFNVELPGEPLPGVAELQRKLYEMSSIPEWAQRVFYKGRYLRGPTSLSDQGVPEGGVLLLCTAAHFPEELPARAPAPTEVSGGSASSTGVATTPSSVGATPPQSLPKSPPLPQSKAAPMPKPLQHPRLASSPPGAPQSGPAPQMVGPGMAQAVGPGMAQALMQLLTMPEGNQAMQGQTSMHVITTPTATRVSSTSTAPVASPPTKAPPTLPPQPPTQSSTPSQSGPGGSTSSTAGATPEAPQVHFAKSISAMMQSLGPQLISRLSPQPGGAPPVGMPPPTPVPINAQLHAMMMPMEQGMMTMNMTPMGFPGVPVLPTQSTPSIPPGSSSPAPSSQGTSQPQ